MEEIKMENSNIQSIVNGAIEHLSSIGKRVYSNDGKNLFEDITTSSSESSTLLVGFAREAIRGVIAELQPIVEDIDETCSITVRKPYVVVNASKITNYIHDYAVQYSAGSFLAMTHMDYAKPYFESCVSIMKQIKAMAYQKTISSGSLSYENMTDASETLNKTDNEQDNKTITEQGSDS